MADHIAISGIEVYAYHGVLTEEREQGQRFLVDVDMTLDLGLAGESDDLRDTVDYGALAAAVHDLVAGERWDLLERVASRVADLVLGHSGVEAVTVTVHKPDAPIHVPFSDVRVVLTRPRP